MDPVPAALADALSGRYRIERELGRGGMATVYLARDLKHERQVALKVLRAELAIALGPERFLREIRITAGLQHPHILPVFDSGQAGDDREAIRLWYTMPYVDGETLRGRLEREQRLPIADVLRIAGQVAAALQDAHEHGIVHRDIKPENILLTRRGEVLVADFGIATALAEPGHERLTATGIRLGTPMYMAPEQIAGDRVEARADIYALGCVVYEMLAGEPPFTGESAVEVTTRRFREPPPPLRSRRPDVPEAAATAVARALAVAPQERFASAAEFIDALTGGSSERADALPAKPGSPYYSRTVRPLLAATAVILAAGGLALAGWRRTHDSSRRRIDRSTVAVLPFRIGGADPSFQYLSEGMIDLLSAKLTGEGGLRAADPRSVVQAWRRVTDTGEPNLPQVAGLRIAEHLGAGQVLLGSVVGNQGHVVLGTKVLRVPDGATLGQAVVEGTADSLPVLVDRLAAQLLARGAGQTGQRLAELTSASLPAIRAYLEGQAAYRRGHYADARENFNRALETDSSFALAALGVAATGPWLGLESARAHAIAWAGRERLGPRDRALAIAFAGPRFPGPTPLSEQLAAWVRALEAAPDRAEAWFYAGDLYFHFGALLGLARADEQARAYFQRAAELDPQAVAPLSHLVELAALRGDTAEAARLADRFLAVDSAGEVADFIRWRVAIARGDSSALQALRARFGDMAVGSLLRIIQTSQELATGLDDADRAAEVLARRSGTPTERAQVYRSLASLALNRGRPGIHSRIMDELAALDRGGHGSLRVRIGAALYGDGDRTEGAHAAAALARYTRDSLASAPSERWEQYADACLLGLWRVAAGERGAGASMITRLRTPVHGVDSAGATMYGEACAVLLEATLTVTGGRSAGDTLMERLDSLLQAGVPLFPPVPGDLLVARLRELQGRPEKAPVALHRRARWSVLPADYLGSYFREEARVAAAVGDREAAIHAWQRYLALRSSPEAALSSQVEQARAELAALVGETKQ
jgi:serine/threonine-protein kinase